MAGTAALFDVNAWLGAWPFQYFHEDTARKLDDLMASEGVGRALVCSPEAVFNPDTEQANRVLVKRLAGTSRLQPVMTLNPMQRNWPDQLARARDLGTPAVRLMPMHHCYELAAAPVISLVEAIARDGGPVLTLQLRMEDKRTQHPRAVIPGLEVASIVALAARFPALSIVALCAYRSEAQKLGKETGNVLVDLSHVESMRTVSSLLGSVPAERILLGTHAPFLYARSAVLKMQAEDVPEGARRAIGRGNAERVFGRRKAGAGARG